MIKIHNFARGARGQRVMWQCEEMSLPYVVQNHSYPVDQDYLRLHPLGTVPFLEDSGGVAINESIAMMLFLAQKYGPTPLLPLHDAAYMARTLQLTLFGETELGANLNPLLAARFGAPQEDKRNWSILRLEEQIERALQYTAAAVRDRSFVAGEQFTLADISVSCALGLWQGALGGALPPELQDYQNRLRARPQYAKARSRCLGADA